MLKGVPGVWGNALDLCRASVGISRVANISGDQKQTRPLSGSEHTCALARLGLAFVTDLPLKRKPWGRDPVPPVSLISTGTELGLGLELSISPPFPKTASATDSRVQFGKVSASQHRVLAAWLFPPAIAMERHGSGLLERQGSGPRHLRPPGLPSVIPPVLHSNNIAQHLLALGMASLI